MPPTTLLTLMIATYAIPIAFVYYKYSTATARSISSIITSKEPFITITDNNVPPVFTMFQTRHFIAACMLLMAVFTIAYEYQRCVTQHTQWSLFAIIALLIGIFGVIFIPEHDSTHYIFATTAFFAILGFMVGHTYYSTAGDTAAYDTLRILLYAQFLFMVVTVIGVIQDAPIFATEALFLLNFAVFYLYLHGENYTFSISTPSSSSPSSSTR
jgi:hypothetical protein